MSNEIKRFAHDGTINADGRVFEPPDLWENYARPARRLRQFTAREAHRGDRTVSPPVFHLERAAR